MNEPISALMIQEKLSGQEWKIQTINTLLKRLLKREVIRFEKVKNGKTYAYYYTSQLTKDDYKGLQSNSFLNRVHQGSLRSFVSALVHDKSVSERDLSRARKWLKDWEDNHGN